MAVKKVKVVFSSKKSTIEINKFLNELSERIGVTDIEWTVKADKNKVRIKSKNNGTTREK